MQHTHIVYTIAVTGLLLPCLASTALGDTGVEPAPEPAVEAAPIEVAGEPQPGTPISMDRSHWPRIVITPADGSVTHDPHYVGSVPMRDDEVSPLHAPDPVWQIQEALIGADADNLSGENLTDLVTQPFIGLARMVLLPFQAVIQHPWADATSP